MIRFEHVTKDFTGRSGTLRAVNDVSLNVEKGDIYGIIGLSGAGKSTLIRMVNRLEVPTSGTVSVDGENLAGLRNKSLRFLRRKIGMIFQQFNLLESKTVWHNVALPLILQHLPKAEIKARVEKVLSFVELEEKAGTYVSNLSGGQKQRVGIARALATNPSILLCDEATSALDVQTTNSILELLKKVNREMGVTILLITHQIQVIQQICNKVAVMQGGRVIEQGYSVEVFKNPEAALTKQFVASVFNEKVPQSILNIVRNDGRNFRIERLKFVGDSVKKPVIAEICRIEGVEVNILCANVEEMQDTVFCVFIVQLIGNEENISKAEALIDSSEIIRNVLEAA
ncbi:MAG: ATP-binding cassette domain-containing protein [Treponema sp.]|nr:ATP-binding cassette domain-containing protein [Treponema sp.]